MRKAEGSLVLSLVLRLGLSSHRVQPRFVIKHERYYHIITKYSWVYERQVTVGGHAVERAGEGGRGRPGRDVEGLSLKDIRTLRNEINIFL